MKLYEGGPNGTNGPETQNSNSSKRKETLNTYRGKASAEQLKKRARKYDMIVTKKKKRPMK